MQPRRKINVQLRKKTTSKNMNKAKQTHQTKTASDAKYNN